MENTSVAGVAGVVCIRGVAGVAGVVGAMGAMGVAGVGGVVCVAVVDDVIRVAVVDDVIRVAVVTGFIGVAGIAGICEAPNTENAMNDRIERAKVSITLMHPWLAVAMFQLRFVESSDVPTMATDGTYLCYNDKFVSSLSNTECRGVIMHELAHCILLHPYRRQHRDPVRWNIACDAAVNAILLATGLKLPAGCVPPAALGKTAEEIYDELDAASLPQSLRDLLEPGDTSDGAPPMSESAWRDVLAQSRGLAPADALRSLEAAAEPQIDWRSELAMWVCSTVRADTHTWSRPHRRYPAMPGWRRDPHINLAVCIDTSGSIDAHQLNAFWSEFSAIQRVSGVSAYLISADAAVHQVVEPETPVDVTNIVGGGGTSFVPALAKCEELGVPCVYLTDGDGEYPSEVGIDVLWVLTRKTTVPFGRAILLSKGE